MRPRTASQTMQPSLPEPRAPLFAFILSFPICANSNPTRPERQPRVKSLARIIHGHPAETRGIGRTKGLNREGTNASPRTPCSQIRGTAGVVHELCGLDTPGTLDSGLSTISGPEAVSGTSAYS